MITDFYRRCVILEKTTTNSDGFIVENWVDGAELYCGIARSGTNEAQIGEKSGMTATFNIVFPDAYSLKLNDRIKDTTSGTVYRITSDSADLQTPSFSDLHLKCVNAEVIRV